MRPWLFILVLLGAPPVKAGFDGDPFYQRVELPGGDGFLAVRPFYSRWEEGERWREDYLWPLYARKGFKDEFYARFLFVGWHNRFSVEEDRYRTWVLPFWFQGTSATGEDYCALFPIGGSIHEFLGRDKVSFVLFPLYGKSHVNEVRTTSVLWPVFSSTSGDKVQRFRIWPFYGTSTLEGEYEKKFVLWPIYLSVEYTNERNPGGGFVLMPLYGRIATEKASNHWLLPPFFRYAASEGQWIVHAPWPFIQLADGDLHKRVFWPLCGKKRLGTQTQQYLLWPLFWNNRAEYPAFTRHRRLALPFVAHECDVAAREAEGRDVGDVLSRYWKVWPLASWDRTGDDSRFRMLELWPLRDTAGVERNWAPFWTLYRRTATGGETGHHLLWGLYRQTSGPERFEWSLLKGLAGYKRSESIRQYRLLFMRFGGEEQP